jgi:diguanylate cyclase (GGDEF)-like protein
MARLQSVGGVVAVQEEKSSSKRNASVRFIEQFLNQTHGNKLVGLLLGQIDAFNRIVTTFGHDECEKFCAQHAEKLRASLPPRTPIIRLAQRRFAVLIAADSMTAIMDAAVRLTEENAPQLEIEGDSFLVDVTVGVAVHPSHADDATTLFRRAELALKEARENELAFDIYRPDATQQHAALWKFESELKAAVQNNRLEVYYQPKLELDSGRVSGVEVLVRWRTQSGRFVPAGEFIPLAERTGSIVQITWLVFDRIVETLGDWKRIVKPFSIAVNVSPQALVDGGFVTRVRMLKSKLDEHGFGLTIELTEDSLVQSNDASLIALERIRKLGIELAIDDFGKGYSSLTYLKQIPATEIKIDKRFVGTIAVDNKDREIVKTVIALAHALGMKVVAEGVDSAQAMKVIGRLGCEMAQGFFIARPMRRDLIPDWIEHYTASSTSNRLTAGDGWLARAEAASGS